MPHQPCHIHQIVEIHPADVFPDRVDRLFSETPVVFQRIQKRARFDLQQIVPLINDHPVFPRHLQRRGGKFPHPPYRGIVLCVSNSRGCPAGGVSFGL